jgi:hypothetical protein
VPDLVPETPRPLRIGVTGSRKYGSPAVIRAAFEDAWLRLYQMHHTGVTVVHGQCNPQHPDTGHMVGWNDAKKLSWEVQGRLLGADWLAEWVALDMHWQVERHPADWYPQGPAGRYWRGAGFARNSEMVKAGADEWEAFALRCSDHRCYRADPHASHGTAHCAGLAAKAGIPVYPYGADGPDSSLLSVADGKMGT